MKLSPFTDHILTEIQQKTNLPIVLRHINPQGGESINESFKIETSSGNFFLKRNDRLLYPNMFVKEAEGLNLLKQNCTIHIPDVISVGEYENYQFLILRFIDKGLAGKTFWEDFGNGLAQLHKHSQTEFGLTQNNYIGSLPQQNKPQKDWTTFFIQERLQPMVAYALTHKKLSHAHYDRFQLLYKKIENFFPEEKPSLLHGDLWNGNFMANADGHPVIFDPAVYYGHREMDIAMTKLFGGFHEKFYSSYHETYPLNDGWEERIKICNLYPLLVHVNLFGGSYKSEVETILNQLV